MRNQIRSSIPVRIIVAIGDLYSDISKFTCTSKITICWPELAQTRRGGPVKNCGKVPCRSQIERGTSHSSGTEEAPDFHRSHKVNWTPNHNRGWVEACAHDIGHKALMPYINIPCCWVYPQMLLESAIMLFSDAEIMPPHTNECR